MLSQLCLLLDMLVSAHESVSCSNWDNWYGLACPPISAVIFNCDLHVSRIKLYWKSKFSKNSGKGMSRNLYGREILNHLWRKLYYRYRIGVSILVTSRCRSTRVVAFSSGSNLSSAHLKKSGWDFLARYMYGRSVRVSPSLLPYTACVFIALMIDRLCSLIILSMHFPPCRVWYSCIFFPLTREWMTEWCHHRWPSTCGGLFLEQQCTDCLTKDTSRISVSVMSVTGRYSLPYLASLRVHFLKLWRRIHHHHRHHWPRESAKKPH